MVYLGKRQACGDNYDDGDYYHGSWWYSDTAEVIKWAVLAAIFIAIFLFLALGWVHARRRVRRGQAPLRYHRWLLPRSQRRSPPTQPFTFYQHQQNPYEMHPYPAPPPAYRNNEEPPPPRYEPPQGASKMNPDQQTFPRVPPRAGEASNSGPVSAAPEHQQAPAERFDAVPLQGNDSELPPRPQSSGRSWNPLKRFK
ncbi:MAG: hypothetical protein L6R42_006196 [Xanthoria sp. 1 TBL-2021]|nr:MAG: hypothetical protein L6R42_006196 [Xanthoria sp. 1 TBL-2021]